MKPASYALGALTSLMFLNTVTYSSDLIGETRMEDQLQKSSEFDKEMERSIDDIFDNPLEFEGRYFSFDRANAFNTSVAFTIPLFSFTLPGAKETTQAGLDGNNFGVMAFVTLFLLGGLGVAIYTTTRGGNEDAADADGRKFGGNGDYWNYSMASMVHTALEDFAEALNVESCTQLAICSAHAEPLKYKFVGWPLRFFIGANNDIPEYQRSNFEKAAYYGLHDADECFYEYPCLIQPLEIVNYAQNYLLA